MAIFILIARGSNEEYRDDVEEDEKDKIEKMACTYLGRCNSSIKDWTCKELDYSGKFSEGTSTITHYIDGNKIIEPGIIPEETNHILERILTVGLDVVMSGIVDSLTNLGLESTSFTINGTVSTMEVFIQVNWA
ncbi:unnamed protein product [Penicillium glandicola]